MLYDDAGDSQPAPADWQPRKSEPTRPNAPPPPDCRTPSSAPSVPATGEGD